MRLQSAGTRVLGERPSRRMGYSCLEIYSTFFEKFSLGGWAPSVLSSTVVLIGFTCPAITEGDCVDGCSTVLRFYGRTTVSSVLGGPDPVRSSSVPMKMGVFVVLGLF